VDAIHQLQLALSRDPKSGLAPADISFCAPLDMSMVVPASADLSLRVRDMFGLYRYENWLFTMKLTGKQVKDSMEFVYARWFETMKTDKDQLILFQKDGAGAIQTMADGKPFSLEKTYVVAINSYRAPWAEATCSPRERASRSKPSWTRPSWSARPTRTCASTSPSSWNPWATDNADQGRQLDGGSRQPI